MTPFLTSHLAAPHGFFTRLGGVSTGAYASLNCGFSRDDPTLVQENRTRAAMALGYDKTALLGLKQVHGAQVITVENGWAEGEGPEADALVTCQPGLALAIITADCAPVLLRGDNGAVGAAHAGWRGAVAGVLEATIEALYALGAKTVQAAIGPCIHQASYEVGPDVRDAVLAVTPGAADMFTPGRVAHFWFNLPGYCALRLAMAGVEAEILPYDTCAREDLFFSYRRRTLHHDTANGHQISMIGT